MNEQIAINSLEFAHKSLEIHGTIALRRLGRLHDVLFSPDGELDYQLKGGVDAQGRPELRLHVHGELNLACQRCLGPVAFPLDTVSRFVIVANEDMMPPPGEEQDDVDCLPADPHLDVLALIEDEVLLGLPLAPVHEAADCANAVPEAQEQKESPFKVLQGLKLGKS